MKVSCVKVSCVKVSCVKVHTLAGHQEYRVTKDILAMFTTTR